MTPSLVSSFLSAPASLSLLRPCPLLLHPPLPSLPLSHTIALSLPLSLPTVRAGRVERLGCISVSLFRSLPSLRALPSSSDCHSAAETPLENSSSSASEAGRRRREDRRGNELGIPQRTEESFVPFRLLKIDLFRCLFLQQGET